MKTSPSNSEAHAFEGPDLVNDAVLPRKLHADDASSVSLSSHDKPTAALLAENNELRKRVEILEDLVKQAFALNNLGGFQATTTTIDPRVTSLNQSTASDEAALDWDKVLSQSLMQRVSYEQTVDIHPGSEMTVSTALTPIFPPILPNAVMHESGTKNLARHPAAVATTRNRVSLQRARIYSDCFEMTAVRLSKAAQVVSALARIRGWTNPIVSQRKMLDRCGLEHRKFRHRRRRAGDGMRR